jgi:glycosyltransferase involved in cell wall biosynthesis
MNILIITQYFWPENFKINDLADSFQKRGHEITVLTGIPNYPEGRFYNGYGFFKSKTEFYKNIKIIRTWLFPRGNANPVKLFLNFFSFAFFASFAVIFRIKSKFDLIFVFEVSPVTVGIPAIVLKKIRRIPIFFWVQDLWPESIYATTNIKSEQFKKCITKLVKYIYRNCDKIFVSSKGFIKSIVEKGVEPAKIEYIPVWAEDDYMNCDFNDYLCYDSLIPSGSFNIVFAGNIGEAQDFESIIKAVEYLNKNEDIKWFILGDGRKRRWLENEIKAKALEKKIYLLGQYPIISMPYFFSKADALIITLKNDYIFSLTVPAKLQTYMSCGKPILAMVNGEAAKIINDARSGYVSNSGDYVGFANNILKIYDMENEERRALGINARTYYNIHFNKEKILNQIENLFLINYKKK